MDLVDLVASFATGTAYAVRRRTAGGFTRGVANATTDSTFLITASVQPAAGEDLLRLPEGRRANQTRVLFTTTQLFTGDQDATYEADYVTIDGQEWECQHCEVWVQWANLGTAYRAILQQPTDGANAA